MKKLVVGCGYLGLRVAREWLSSGHEVFALTRSPARGEHLAALGIQPYVGDVTQRDTLADLPPVDTVLYAVGFDRGCPQSRQSVLVDGLTNTWRTMQDRSKRWLYISSTSVYGVSDGSFVDETAPCEPTTEAGRVCWLAEQTLHKHARLSNIEHSVLRSAGLYGPGRLLRRVADVTSGQPVAGRPDAFLNLVHVDDMLSAVLAAETHGQPGHTYLIADGQHLTRRDYFSQLAQLLAAPEPRFDPRATPARTTGLNKRCRIDKALRELHWEPQYPTAEDGLRQALTENSPK